MKTLQVTPQIGLAIKNFRVENQKTSKDVAYEIAKAPSYLSKLEKGDIKKIEVDLFVNLINTIGENKDNSLSIFCDKLFEKTETLDGISLSIAYNIDSVLCRYKASAELFQLINNEMNSNNISIPDLVNELNSNKSIVGSLTTSEYKMLPDNEWVYNEKTDSQVVKLNYSEDYIQGLIVCETHSVIYLDMEALLFTLYKLKGIDETTARDESINTLVKYNVVSSSIKRIKNKKSELMEKMKNISNNPEFLDKSMDIIMSLTYLSAYDESYAFDKMKIMTQNLHADPSFTVAFMGTNLLEIIKQPKEVKTQFFSDLKGLIEKHATQKSKIDLY